MGSKLTKYGNIIIRDAKLPIPGIHPLINPDKMPTMAGDINSVIQK